MRLNKPSRFYTQSYINAAATFVLILMSAIGFSQKPMKNKNFQRDEIVAWCIVPFDTAKRGPVERSEMLNNLGITKLAYDWRDEHIPTFDAELDALNKHHIKLQAFWLLSGAEPQTEKGVLETFKFFERRKVKTQVWYMFIPPDGFDRLSQDEKVRSAAKAVKYIAERAAAVGCTVGLYNHEGWYGEPENELAILQQVKMKNVGLVYNFNHAQEHTERFAAFFPKILPHLLALNLAGLRKGDQHIYPISEGDSEQKMIGVILKSGYKGPIGIINEDTDPDAKVGLEMNMRGLKKILIALGANQIAASYPD